METSKLLSDESKKTEEENSTKIRLIMKYRLYGVDGLTKHEMAKLKGWGEIKKLKKELTLPTKVKRRVDKMRIVKGAREVYTDDESGSGDSTYTLKMLEGFEDNE